VNRFVALALSAVLFGCSSGGGTSDARISGREIVFKGRKAELPASDLARGQGPSEVREDASARRLAYPTPAGLDRILYVVGDGLFVGPLVAHPADFSAIPHLDHALGPLFEQAGLARSSLVREIRRERGERGVAALLVDAAYVDDVAWEETRKQLAPEQAKTLRDGLVRGLEAGKAGILLRRAVATVDLEEPLLVPTFEDRVKELVANGKEPRAAAVLLRALLAQAEDHAAKLACDALRAAHDQTLLEAAALVVAKTHASCTERLSSLLGDPCQPFYRCGTSGPIGWADTSKQDEPLCTKEDFAKAVNDEAKRSPRAVLDGGASRPGLFALAALLERGDMPPVFIAAHERRLYALTQPDAPSCESTLAPGTPCHCDEATVRQFACRNETAVGVCRFTIDDKQKKLVNVVKRDF
jgi:hypothetical protein